MKDGIFLSLQAIKELTRFASKSDSRFALVGVSIDASDPKKPIAEATDGHRLHRIQLDNTHINSPDSYALTKSYLEMDSAIVGISSEQLSNFILRLKEIMAIGKVQRKPAHYINICLKFTKKRILLKGRANCLIRYIEPFGDIPESIEGMTIGANVRYLLDALECFAGTDIKIMVESPRDAIIIKTYEDDVMYPLHVLMPVHLYPERIS